MVIPLLIFILTITLVMIRPKPFNEVTASALGALVMLVTGAITPLNIWEVLQTNINVLLFFLGLMIICVIADQAGFFEWCSIKAAKLSKGKGPLLLSVLFGLGTLITAFFSNDATALILTPIVFALVTRLKLSVLPYVFACAFIANTASMLLPVSNPVNLLAVERFQLTLGEYIKYLFLPGILVVGANLILFRYIFRREISTISRNYQSPESIKVDKYFLLISIGLGFIALGYIFVSILGLPLFYPAIGGAGLLIFVSFWFKRLKINKLSSGISWNIFLFIFALALLIKGLDNAGITNSIANLLASLAHLGTLPALLSVTFGTAIGSNLINNWSMMMVSVSSLANLAGQTQGFDKVLIYGAIMGADLGPNITILGSLSSMLWLILLRQRGLDIRPVQFLKLGLIVTPVLLIIGVLSLYLCSRFWG
jgi:arsenical pump membrane protein